MFTCNFEQQNLSIFPADSVSWGKQQQLAFDLKETENSFKSPI